MLPRIFGVLVLLLGVALSAFAVLGFSNARDMSLLIGAVSNSADSGSEASRWLRHWHLSTVVMLVSGLALTAAGIGLLVRRRWSVLLVASVAVLLALQDVIMWAGGWARYAFEAPEPLEVVFLLLVATASIVAFRRWHPAKQS